MIECLLCRQRELFVLYFFKRGIRCKHHLHIPNPPPAFLFTRVVVMRVEPNPPASSSFKLNIVFVHNMNTI